VPAAASNGDPLARFCTELEAVGGVAHRVRDPAELERVLCHELVRFGATRIVTAARHELSAFAVDWLWQALDARAVNDALLSDDLELRTIMAAAQVGITAVDFALADTGSLVVSARPGAPRGLSLLPALHVALVLGGQVVADLDHALRQYAAAAAGLPSAIHVITGPSRTSDIENDLTIGVHGPAAVLAIVLEQSA
jgi:L-lactate dehydrogenase complex protein LldG